MAESAEAGSTYCFMLLSLRPRVANQQPTVSVASASHSQASWAQLPLPPPLAPTLVRSQQPEGHHHAQQQRDFREESEARTVNNTVPEAHLLKIILT
jgi:hypothetical protein